MDYPDYAHPVALAVETGEAAFGILLCGSGNGVAITANKHQGVRAAICWGEELSKLASEHNNANIICIPARFVREGDAEKMVDIFLHTEFEGGRHQQRVEKISLHLNFNTYLPFIKSSFLSNLIPLSLSTSLKITHMKKLLFICLTFITAVAGAQKKSPATTYANTITPDDMKMRLKYCCFQRNGRKGNSYAWPKKSSSLY